ncbi:MAG: CPBP family intramembrane glutamic endopeptidase, partial [Henriciella sp.]
VAVWSWTASGRSLESLGLNAGTAAGWQVGVAWGIAIAVMGQQLVQLRMIDRNDETRLQLKDMLFSSGDYDQVMPRRRKDVWAFQLVAVTAGITEEVVFRGFLIGVFAMFMPVWPAAGLALAVFVLAHAYQGWKGMLRILPISVILTLVFVLSGSLWPGILLHIFVDILGGHIAWKLLPKEGYLQIDDAQPIG